MSPDSFYFLAFVALSAAIGLPPWPHCSRRWGVALALVALLLASGLGWKIAIGELNWDSVLHNELTRMLPDLKISREAAKARGVDQTWNVQFTALRDLPRFLKGLLLLLAGYLLVRTLVLALSWIWVGLRRLGFRWRPPPHPVCSGQLSIPLDDSDVFLRQVANGGLLVLGLLLAAIPYWVRYGDPLFGAALVSPVAASNDALRQVTFVDPPLLSFFSTVVWVGVWVLLLELRFFYAAFEPRADWSGSGVSTRTISNLEPLYRAYVDQHSALLLFQQMLPPVAGGLPPAPTAELDEPEAAAQRLQLHLHGLPYAALDALLPPLRHGQRGGDLLFTETLSAHHLLLAALLLQQCRQAGETALLIAPASALEPLERALRHAIARHHLLLNQRWVILGRDEIAADTQADVLGCAAEDVENRLLDQTELLADKLGRLRLVLCLESQRMELSGLRLALSRLWLRVPRERVRLIVQADGWHDMESQLRYLTRLRDPMECRLNPQLSVRRYLLVWDADSPQRKEFSQHYFPQSQDFLETAPLLLLLPWRMGFAVAPRAAPEHHNADTCEYLKNVLLPQQGQQALSGFVEQYQPLAYPVADPPIQVIQVEDTGNLPLALDRGTPVAEIPEILLNVVCGRYLLRDYYLDCLGGASGETGLPHHLRPLATRPRGTLPQLAAALGAALKQGLRATQVQQGFLDLAPPGLLPPELKRADLPSLRRLFERVLGGQAPRVQLRREQGETVFFTAPDHAFDPQPRLPVVDEQGRTIAALPESDHGLGYAPHQYILIRDKYHLVKTVGAQIRVHHEDDPRGWLRRCYVFQRRYVLGERQLSEGDGFVQQWPGEVSLRVSHWHGRFTGESLGYLEFAPDARPLASEPPSWSYTPLDDRPTPGSFPATGESDIVTPSLASQEKRGLRRDRSWQSVACLELRHPALEDPEARARLAFTLCAVWQDSLPSLFPGQAHRLAVVSPQATALPEPDNDRDRFYRRLYPAWAGGVAPDEAILQVYLLEDADHDLGVVRAQVQPEGLRVTLALLRDYLAWAKEQPSERLYHAYGAEALPAYLDYTGVEKLLEPLASGWTRPATASPLLLPDHPTPSPSPQSATALALSPASNSTLVPTAPKYPGIATDLQPLAFCDFCAAPLGSGGVTLESDGRQRCHRCGQDAIDSLAAFRRLWDEVVEGMERRYDIALPQAVRVRFVDAAEVMRRAGQRFHSTPSMDIRTAGVLVPAWSDVPTLWLESGAPRLSTMAILVRVLTHLWQASLGVKCKPCPVELLDGQALYATIDYLTAHGGEALAMHLRRQAENGNDPSACGYRRLAPQCPADPQMVFGYFQRLLGLEDIRYKRCFGL